ncbi:MAG: hypothetical protein IJM62_01975 [Lachnospiraceae bacterium]|nr:hypothetical protein [Lachnospiraceae bacterium]
MYKKFIAALISLLLFAAAACVQEEVPPETEKSTESQTEIKQETETETESETADRSKLSGFTLRQFLSGDDAFKEADERILSGDVNVKAVFMTEGIIDELGEPDHVEEMWNRMSAVEICTDEPGDTKLREDMLYVKFVWEDGFEYAFSFPSRDTYDGSDANDYLTADPDAVKRIADSFLYHSEHRANLDPTEPETEKPTETETQTQTQTETQTQTQTQTETQTQTQTETQTQTQTQSQTEPPEPETECRRL